MAVRPAPVPRRGGVIFTAIHVGAILLDSYVHFSLVNVLVPFTGTWHPVAVAWGIVALYLLLAVELTSLARARVPKRLWRRVHYGSFGLYALSSIHAVSAGTDGRSPAFLVAVVASIAVIGALTAIRVARARAATPLGAAMPARPDAMSLV